MEGNEAKSLSVSSLTADEFTNLTPAAIGTPIAGAKNSAKNLGLPDPVAEVKEEATEGDGDGDAADPDAEEEGGDEAEEEAADDAFADGDDWGDEGDDASEEAEDAGDEATDEATDAADDGEEKSDDTLGDLIKKGVDAIKEVIRTPDATYEWYQPAVAKSYSGLRRYGSGDKVQVYSLGQQADAATAFEATT